MAKPLLGMLQSWDHHHSLMWKASQKKAEPHQQNQVLMAPAQSKVPIRQKGQLVPVKGACIFVPAAPKAKLAMPGIKAFHIGCCLESRIMLVFVSGGALSFNNDATVILCL